MTTTGEKIRVVRRALNLTLNELGEKIGLSGQQMQKYEAGKDNITISKLYAIAKALSVNIIELLPTSELGEGKINVLNVLVNLADIPIVLKFLHSLQNMKLQQKTQLEAIIEALKTK